MFSSHFIFTFVVCFFAIHNLDGNPIKGANAQSIVQTPSSSTSTRVAVQVINTGSQYRVDPTYIAQINARYPNLSTAIVGSTGEPVGAPISAASVINTASIYRVSTGSQGEPLGEMDFIVGASASFALLRFNKRGGTMGMFGEVLLIAGQTPTNAIQLAKFTRGSGTLTSLDGITGILSVGTVGDIVEATGTFRIMLGGRASLTGIVSIDALAIGPGVNSTSDLIVLLSYNNRGGGYWFEW